MSTLPPRPPLMNNLLSAIQGSSVSALRKTPTKEIEDSNRGLFPAQQDAIQGKLGPSLAKSAPPPPPKAVSLMDQIKVKQAQVVKGARNETASGGTGDGALGLGPRLSSHSEFSVLESFSSSKPSTFNTNVLENARRKSNGSEELNDSSTDNSEWDDNLRPKPNAPSPVPPATVSLRAPLTKPPSVLKPPPMRPQQRPQILETQPVESPTPSIQFLNSTESTSSENSETLREVNISNTPQPTRVSFASDKVTASGEANAKVAALEEEIVTLKRRLQMAEGSEQRIPSASSSVAYSNERERRIILEAQVEQLHNELDTVKQERFALKLSIKELQSMLSKMEAVSPLRVGKDPGTSSSPIYDTHSNVQVSSMQDLVQKNEREKVLEQQVI